MTATDLAGPVEQRWVVVGGRRWRATDPSIPETLRSELVAELMDARRAVAAARRRASTADERRARDRVQDAKLALGERGEPWWEPHTDAGLDRRLEAAIRALARRRGVDKTFCPSDAARIAGGARWRDAVEPARRAARLLAEAGVVDLRQRGARIDPSKPWRGPVRIGLASHLGGETPNVPAPPGAKHWPHDHRPTPFQADVVAVVAALPPGELVTYDDLAQQLGRPGSAQAIANVLRSAPGLPWWRVLPSEGRLYRTHEPVQRPLLEAEGHDVDENRRVTARGRPPR
jgi:alkylated DNA nucleotide flippase Atl1